MQRIFDLDLPTIDITCQDGTIHGTKGKKYPELMKLQEDTWTIYMEYKDGVYESITVEGKKVRLMQPVYKTGEDTTYKPFAVFEEFCDFNGVSTKDISVKKALSNIEKIKAESEKMKKLMERYSDKISSLDGYRLNTIGALYQSSRNVYAYS